jgi:hypothetical protein
MFLETVKPTLGMSTEEMMDFLNQEESNISFDTASIIIPPPPKQEEGEEIGPTEGII